jgi:multiple sugar transport system substrate-binding protein
MKKIISIAVCLFILLTLIAGCQQAQTTATTKGTTGSTTAGTTKATTTAVATTAAPKEVKLQLSIYGDDARRKRFQDLADKFTEKNPNIKVEVILIPFGELAQKLAVQLAAKTAPDVTWLSEKMIPQFLDSKSLVSLEALKSDPIYDYNDISPSSLEIYIRDGKVYGIPFSCGPRVFYYNIDLFQAKGLKTPDQLVAEGKWTLDELYNTAKQLTDKANGVYGIKLFPATSPDDWINALYDLVWSNGADFFAPDMSKFALNTPEGIKAMQYYYDMLFKDEIHPKPGDLTQFESGKIGIARDFVSYTGSIRTKVTFKWDIAPNPVGPAGPATKIAVGQASYSCLVGDAEDSALLLLKYFTSKEIMTEFISSFICSRKSVLESPALLNQPDGKPSSAAMMLAVATPLSNPGSRALPAHPNFNQIDVEMKKLFDMMYTKSFTVEQIVQKMEETVNPLLK